MITFEEGVRHRLKKKGCSETTVNAVEEIIKMLPHLEADERAKVEHSIHRILSIEDIADREHEMEFEASFLRQRLPKQKTPFRGFYFGG